MLGSLIKTIPASLSYEVVLINDASTDETRPWLDSLKLPNIHIIHNETNQGYAKTNNIAVKASKGEVLALLNNDLVFSDDWLSSMLMILESKELKAGIVGNIQYRVATKEIDHAGVALSHKAQFIHKHNFDADKAYSKQLAVTGACMLISRKDFDEVRGFTEDYINGCEDLDLCFKIKQQGQFIYLSHKSAIQHHVSLSRDLTNLKNEMNSRLLLKTWRNLIKQELSLHWSQVISNNDESAIKEHIDGKLLVNSPHTISRFIAENLIGREEHRWEKLLDKKDYNKLFQENCTFKGLKYFEKYGCYLIDGDIEFRVKNIDSVVNFYVRGQVINPDLKENIAITININDLQEKTIYLDQEENINAGMIYPIFMPSQENVFKIGVHFYDKKTNELLGDARKSIVITLFVVDDFIFHAYQ